MSERLDADGVLRHLPAILEDATLVGLITKSLGGAVLEEMRLSVQDPLNTGLSDEFIDELYELAINEAEEVQHFDAKGGYDDFAVRVLKFGTIYYVSAIEFDDYGPFISQEEAADWAEWNYESFITAFGEGEDEDSHHEEEEPDLEVAVRAAGERVSVIATDEVDEAARDRNRVASHSEAVPTVLKITGVGVRAAWLHIKFACFLAETDQGEAWVSAPKADGSAMVKLLTDRNSTNSGVAFRLTPSLLAQAVELEPARQRLIAEHTTDYWSVR